MGASLQFYALLFLRTVLYVGAQQLILRVDDSNVYTSANMNGIQYSPEWGHLAGRDANGRFNNTLSVTKTANSAAVFFFKGSSITYYSDRASTEASIMISLDGQSPERVSIEGEWVAQDWLWSSAELDGGDHQLIISRTDSDSRYSLSLDFLDIAYRDTARPTTLGPGSTGAPSEFIVDDGHELIHYEGDWTTMNPDPQQSFFYGGLQHATITPGSSLTFTFYGSEIYYFSDKRAANGWALISIDGGEGVLVSTFLEPWDHRWFSQALCWSKTGLGNNRHTIKITHSDQAGKYVSLDFFKYTPNPSGKKSTPLATIVGGSVGGGLFLLILAVTLYLIHRRRSSTPGDLRTERGGEMKEEIGTPQTAELQTRPLSYISEQWNKAAPRPESGTNAQWTNRLYTGLPEPQTT